MTSKVTPFSLKNAPSLIEKVLPVQKLSVDVYKERMAGSAQTLTALGSFWKGRKPLILNRACVLGALLPATGDDIQDVETFEKLMSMDDVGLSQRVGLRSPEEIISTVTLDNVWNYFAVDPESISTFLPSRAPFSFRDELAKMTGDRLTAKARLKWRSDLSDVDKHRVSAMCLKDRPYKTLTADAVRADQVSDSHYAHIWHDVNKHLGTDATSVPELVEQLGVMRFGHRPRVADTFSGSGQIPFEAARIGCDSIASDLNPIACALTWGGANIVGADPADRKDIEAGMRALCAQVRRQIDKLGFETDGKGWRGKVYLYCLEALCPSSGWRVPVLSSLVVSVEKRVVARLVPLEEEKRYRIELIKGATDAQLKAAKAGTYADETVTHFVKGMRHATKMSSLRGDYTEVIDGAKATNNRVRSWEPDEIEPRPKDVLSERIYAIQWMRDDGSSRPETEFREISDEDLSRERAIAKYVRGNLAKWQREGVVPDMRIEIGGPPRYQGRSLVQNLGWTHWHHAFNPRQLLTNALFRASAKTAAQAMLVARGFDVNSRMSHWHRSDGGGGSVQKVFYNQGLNIFYDYGCRGSVYLSPFISACGASVPVAGSLKVLNVSATGQIEDADIFITDPPYGDAVKYEEILDFFIAWLRTSPPAEFSPWIWDSRRALAIKGENHDFKLAMVEAYRNMASHMPDNGLQIVMFTHQDNAIWADMANIVWASGLRVTAAWYVVTETESALRDGQYVKGTILLVLRKRLGHEETFRDEIAYELEDEVKHQVEMLTGLNDRAKDLYHGENLFEDADIQMAGYAAALRVLTRYAVIDGISMPQEAMRPRVKGQKTMVDQLIDFAVTKANEFLVPHGIDRATWTKLKGSERFYLKIVEAEAGGAVTKSACDNYAKAFKVGEYGDLFEQIKANNVQAKSAQAFGKRSISSGDEFGSSLVRSVLYGIYLLGDGKTKSEDVLGQLRQLIPDYFDRREQIKVLTQFLHKMTSRTRPEESMRAMVLRDLIHNERA